MEKSGIQYIRKRRTGPEQKIENTTVLNVAKLFKTDCNLLWLGGSVPLGAGIPDVVAAVFKPELLNLSQIENPCLGILSYLRSSGSVKESTIVKRLSLPKKIVSSQLEMFQEIGAVGETGGVYRMQESWKNLIQEVVSIEAKVSDWKRAAQQAIRNKVFSHYSYIAFPEKVALRVKDQEVFRNNGLGILSIKDNELVMLKSARKSSSIVWEYYYKLGYYIASYYCEEENAF